MAISQVHRLFSGCIICCLGLMAGFADAQTAPMVLAISTTASGATVCLPLVSPFNVSIQWGDGTWTNTSTTNASCTATVSGVNHRYSTVSSYTISIFGRGPGPVWLRGFGSGDGSFAWSSSLPSITLRRVDSFGELGISTLVNAFRNTPSLTTLPTVLPSSVTSISGILAYSAYNNVQISSWNTSRLVDISLAFYACNNFNQPLNSWDVSSVTSMYATFSGTPFNQPLNNWNTSRCGSLQGTFYIASSFNQNIDSWDVSRVGSMNQLFQGASNFNQPLRSWNVRNVRDMRNLFLSATRFNQNLTSWCVPNQRTQPANFANSSALQPSFYPLWGTCGGFIPPPVAPPVRPPVRPPTQAPAPIQIEPPLEPPIAEDLFPPLQELSQLCRDALLTDATNVTCIDGRHYYSTLACSVFDCINNTATGSSLVIVPSKSSITIVGNATILSARITFELDPLSSGFVDIAGCVNLTAVSLAVKVNSTAVFIGREVELLRFANPTCSSTSDIQPDVEITSLVPDSGSCSKVKATATTKQPGRASGSLAILFSLDSSSCAAPKDQQSSLEASGAPVLAIAIGVTVPLVALVIITPGVVYLIRRQRRKAEKKEEARSQFQSTGEGL